MGASSVVNNVMSANSVFLWVEGKAEGPLPLEAVHSRLRSGEMPAGALFSLDGTSDWKPLNELPAQPPAPKKTTIAESVASNSREDPPVLSASGDHRWKIRPRFVLGAAVVLLVGFWLLAQVNRNPSAAASRSKEPGWEYSIQEVELESYLSPEMSAYRSVEFQEDFRYRGYEGWELAGVLAVPPRREEPYQGRRITYRLIFKRPGLRLDLERPRFDMERFKKAQAAESAAEDKEFKARLDAIGRR